MHHTRNARALTLAVAALLLPARARAAIVYLGDVGNSCDNTIASGNSSLVVTLSSGIAVGSRVIISHFTSSQLTIGTVTDNSGGGPNAWSPDVSFGGGHKLSFISSNITHTLNAGNTITIPYTNTNATQRRACALVSVFTGIASSNAFDQQGAATGGPSMTPSGMTGATGFPNELVVAQVDAGGNAGSFTPGGGYANFSLGTGCNFSFNTCWTSFYKIVNTQGVQTAGGTMQLSDNWLVGVATYKDVCATDGQPPAVTPPAIATVVQTLCN